VWQDFVDVFPGDAAFAIVPGMQQIELKDLFLVGEGPVEGHQTEAGKVIVFGKILLERRQKFPGLYQWIGGVVSLQQAFLDVDVFQKFLEDGAVPEGGLAQPDICQRAAIQPHLGKELLGRHHSSITLRCRRRERGPSNSQR